MRVRLQAMLALAAVALVVPATASAALWLVFSRTSAPPGETIIVRTGGTGALARLRGTRAVKRNPLRVFLVPSAAADEIRTVTDDRVTPVGRLRLDRQGNGRLRFTVPNVPPGDYATLIRCVPCAPHSRGRTLVPGGPVPGPFQILEPVPRVRTCRSSVFGEISAASTEQSPRSGALIFYAYDRRRSATRAWLRRHRTALGTYRVKLLLLVERGAVVTLSIATEDRRAIALAYVPRHFNVARVTRGDAAVTFRACTGDEPVPGADEPVTQFNGSLVLTRPLCAHLRVQLLGRSEPREFDAPFGQVC